MGDRGRKEIGEGFDLFLFEFLLTRSEFENLFRRKNTALVVVLELLAVEGREGFDVWE